MQEPEANAAARPLRIAVTGGAGRIGQAVIRELLDSGHRPTCIDLRVPEGLARPMPYQTRIADLTDLGQVHGVLRGMDAVIHLAAIAWAGRYPPEVTFRTNVMSHFHVLEACASLGIARVATASSIQVAVPVRSLRPLDPLYAPFDEAHPLNPDTEYGLSKEAGEAANRMYHRQYGIQAIALRLPSVTLVEELARNGGPPDDQRVRIFWSYVDPRDAARAFRLAVETDGLGAESFYICADDTAAASPTRDLLQRYYPEAEVRGELAGFAGLVSNRKAAERLGFAPRYSWRNEDPLSGRNGVGITEQEMRSV